MLVNATSNVQLEKSKISFNRFIGIQIMGNSLFPHIHQCVIENNDCSGIQICVGNKCNIRNNDISSNQNGIEILSADPYISTNKVCKNYKEGIIVKAYDHLYCFPILYNNEILSNRMNGVHCIGLNNNTKLINNRVIAYNKMAGVRVDDEAHIVAAKNLILKNLEQGILIVEKSSAHIENNIIKENVKANIAFGGENSCNTAIIRNKIMGSRCEGIFMVESGKSFIHNNEIYDNYDGIIS
jgi:F-box protein 11